MPDRHKIRPESHRLQTAAIAERARIGIGIWIVSVVVPVAAAYRDQPGAESHAFHRRATVERTKPASVVASPVYRCQRIGERDRLQRRAVRKRAIVDSQQRIRKRQSGNCRAGADIRTNGDDRHIVDRRRNDKRPCNVAGIRLLNGGQRRLAAFHRVRPYQPFTVCICIAKATQTHGQCRRHYQFLHFAFLLCIVRFIYLLTNCPFVDISLFC